jgi:hypothetical protein
MQTRNRYTSPVVITATLVVVGTQLTTLSQKPVVNGWDIALAIVTVATTYYAALNNPTNKDGF